MTKTAELDAKTEAAQLAAEFSEGMVEETEIVIPDKTSEIMNLRIGALTIDPNVQRKTLSMPRAAKIGKNFNPEAFGTPAISWRKTNTKVILDGMHRIEGLKIKIADLGGVADDFEIRCEVWRDLTVEQEAKVFLARNNMTLVSLIDRFTVRVTAGDEAALAIVGFAKDLGWLISNTKMDGTIAAIKTLEDGYHRNPWATQKSLEVVTAAWGHESMAVDSRLLAGVIMFFDHYGTQIDIPDLVSKMTTDLTPASLIGKATGRKQIISSSYAKAVFDELLALYNNRRRVSRLEGYVGK